MLQIGKQEGKEERGMYMDIEVYFRRGMDVPWRPRGTEGWDVARVRVTPAAIA